MIRAVAVLGLGSIGLRHTRNLRALGLEPLGFDPDAERRDVARQSGASIVERDAAFRQADAVIVASPSQHHLTDLQEALQHGKPVFVEKPIAADAGALRKLAGAARAPIFPALILRHDAAVRRTREALCALPEGPVNATIIAESFLPDWRPTADYRKGYAADPVYGGALFDHIHEIDLAWHLLGPLRLHAARALRSQILNLPSEDRAEIDVEHRRGKARIVVDYARPGPARRESHFTGAWGAIHLDIMTREFHRQEAGARAFATEQLPGTYEQDYVEQLREFIAVAAGRAVPPCPISEAIDVLEFTLSVRAACGLPSL